jgi:Peroxiredoxin
MFNMKNQFYILSCVLILFMSCSGNKGNDKKLMEANIEALVMGSENENTETITPDERGYIVNIGDMAPDFTVKTTDGKTFTLSDMRGKIIMLQFTASWCSVCREEMPFIESDIWQKHKNNPNFYLVGIDRDEPLEKVVEFVKQTGITYSMALDPGADVFALYADRNAGITRNVIIDKNGKIVLLTRLYNKEEFAEMCNKIVESLNS